MKSSEEMIKPVSLPHEQDYRFSTRFPFRAPVNSYFVSREAYLGGKKREIRSTKSETSPKSKLSNVDKKPQVGYFEEVIRSWVQASIAGIKYHKKRKKQE